MPGEHQQTFQGFGPKVLDFFKALSFHQSREWFQENKSIYESDVKAPFGLLIADLVAGFERLGIPLTGHPEKSIFRLNRDIRFAKDKSPYKTHAGAVLTRDGSKMAPGMLYIHIAPEGSFAAAAFYHPEPPVLASLRHAIAFSQARWLDVEETLRANGLDLSAEEALSRLPKGFDPKEVEKVEHALKLKSLIVQRKLEPASLQKAELVAEIVHFTEEARPLLDFGWAAIDKASGIQEQGTAARIGKRMKD